MFIMFSNFTKFHGLSKNRIASGAQLQTFSRLRSCRQFSYLYRLSHSQQRTKSLCHNTSKRLFFNSTSSMATASEVPRKQNRLSEEKSSYLLQHASNPVDWYPWGPEAFEKARKEDKLIFLSIGYSTCHWCHVMERESFENAAVAKIMNEHYVNIKVDREERPDVDKVYMLFVQAISGGGGWPMSIWLTPDLKPVAGGTYFPPDDRYYGRPGFSSILNSIATQWKDDKQKVIDQGVVILDALNKVCKISKNSQDQQPVLVADEIMKLGLKQLTRGYEPEFGGFSEAPKFPQPVFFTFLFNYYFCDRDSAKGQQALDMALSTLGMMAKGGIHDHVNKGFHRYSTDKEWHVPHFEKMLYDQAQLALAYLTAYQISQRDEFASVCHDVLHYVSRDLTDPNGGFYSAEDADSLPTIESQDKKEGAFCVWTKQQIDELLSGNVSDQVSMSDLFCKFYDVQLDGNVKPYQDPHDELKSKNVLIIRQTVEDVAAHFQLDVSLVQSALDKSLQKLFEARNLRPKPHLDTKILTSWNGMMLSAFAKTGQVFERSDYVEKAVQVANFLKSQMYDSCEGILLRSAYSDQGHVSQIAEPIRGFIDDYAFLIQGLIDLYEATFNPQWLEWSEKLQDTQNELFWDNENFAYFTSRSNDSSIVLRLKEDTDGAEPSGNSVALINLIKLSSYLNRPDYKDKAEQLVSVFSERLKKVPISVPLMASGFNMMQSSPKQVVLVGKHDDEELQKMLKIVRSKFNPHQIVMRLDPEDKLNMLVERHDALKSMVSSSAATTAYVCEDFTCSLPVHSCQDLEQLLS